MLYKTKHYLNKRSLFCDLIVLSSVLISPCKYHKKMFPESFPSLPEYKWILIIRDGLRISQLTKFKQIDEFQICLILAAKFGDNSLNSTNSR